MSILLFLIILVVLILVHEFGHFIAAKRSGIRVDEFGIGFPPRALRIAKKGETEYTLNWLPFGGFVKIFGENPNEESISGPDSKRSFINKPKWIQAWVLIAGVFFNILFAWFLFTIVFMVGMPSALSENELSSAREVRLIISEILPESPIEKTDIAVGDEIIGLSFEGEEISKLTGLTPSVFSEFVASHKDGELTVSLKRGDTLLDIIVTPETNVISEEPERPAVGVAMGLVGLLQFSPPVAIWEGAKFTVEITKIIVLALGSLLVDVATLQADFSTIAGPVGIVGLVGEASALGLVFLLNFTAFISINLAIINLLPFPALDGGRLLFLLVEVVKGSPIRPNIANTLNFVGFVLLIFLMLLVTYNDILRIFN